MTRRADRSRPEDRRVLFTPTFLEDPSHCIAQVILIREHLTNELMQRGDTGTELTTSLRAMRAACRRFLDEVTDTTNRDQAIERRWPPEWAGRQTVG